MVKQFRSCKNSPSTQAGHHPFCSFALLPCSERRRARNDPSWAPLADDHISRKTIAAATATYSQEECSFMQATSFFANVRHHSCTYFTSFQGEFVFRLDHTTLGISERKRNPLPFDGKLCACRGPIFYLVFNALTLLHRINELIRFGNGDAVLHGLHNRTIFPR